MRLLGRIKNNFRKNCNENLQSGGKHLSCDYSNDKQEDLECGKSTRDILSQLIC